MAACGETVLLIDLDPQGNASTGLGIGVAARSRGIYAALLGEADLAEVALPTLVPGLTLVPAEPDLAGAELDLAGLADREFRLRDAIVRHRQSHRGGYVLIDCPPSLGLLTLNGLVSAGSVLIPLQCEFFALEGISQITRTMERIRANLNPQLQLQGIVLTMFDRRNNTFGPRRRRRPQRVRNGGLRNGDPPQRPHLRGTEPRQAGTALRPEIAGRAGLRPARRRAAQARAGPGRAQGRSCGMSGASPRLGRGLAALLGENTGPAAPRTTLAVTVLEARAVPTPHGHGSGAAP